MNPALYCSHKYDPGCCCDDCSREAVRRSVEPSREPAHPADISVTPEDMPEHLSGLEVIRLLSLRRKKENGRVDTIHGDKTPVGLIRTLRNL